MSVESVEKLHEAGGSISLSGESRTVVYAVETSTIADDVDQVQAAPGLPSLGQPYSSAKPMLAVTQINPQRHPERHTRWIVNVTYSTPENQGGGGDVFIVNPLDRPWDIEWGAVTFTEPIDEAFAWAIGGTLKAGGNTSGAGDGSVPIQTVPGEPFDPPPSREFSYDVLTITRNQNTFTANTKILYEHRLNEDTFYGYPPGTALMRPIVARRIIDPSLTYWSVRYEIMFFYNFKASDLSRSWWKRIKHEGYRAIFSPTGEPFEIRDKDGERPSLPVPLDADGARLDPEAAPLWLEFRTHKTIAFAPLQLEV